MDIKTVIAAVPWLRKAWRALPGPLKLPLLVIAAIYAIYRWRRGDPEEALEGSVPAATAGASDQVPGDASAAGDAPAS